MDIMQLISKQVDSSTMKSQNIHEYITGVKIVNIRKENIGIYSLLFILYICMRSAAISKHKEDVELTVEPVKLKQYKPNKWDKKRIPILGNSKL